MDIIEGGFYIVDEQFYVDFPDPNLKKNDEENRPHYYCFKEDNNIIWMIPLSFRVEKCKKEIERRQKEGKPCDYYHILEIAGRESAFIIGDIFPVTNEYIKRAYTISGIPAKLLDKHQISQINTKAKKILVLIRRNIKLHKFQPDVLKIEQILLSQSEAASIKNE
jgi:hypothetical protein